MYYNNTNNNKLVLHVYIYICPKNYLFFFSEKWHNDNDTVPMLVV